MRTQQRPPRAQKQKRSPRRYEFKDNYDLLHPYSVNLALRMNYYRKNHNLTQVELAEKVGIPQTVLSNFESGWANPSLENLVKLAEFFKTTVSDLITRPEHLSKF